MKMKKLTSVLLVAACALSLVACGGSGDKKDSSKGGSSSKTAKVIDIDLTNEEYAFGVDKTQPELLEKTNAFIEKIKGDGTLDKICDKYFGSGEPEAVESAKLDSSKDQLVVATNAAFEPFEPVRSSVLWRLQYAASDHLTSGMDNDQGNCHPIRHISIERTLRPLQCLSLSGYD